MMKIEGKNLEEQREIEGGEWRELISREINKKRWRGNGFETQFLLRQHRI